ncbi:MAG: class II glutamine amidotransferase, partial [Phycisphaerae bacterium]|nr:class II glutamine amidotransferase [Phycisphaerae bacterium]
LTEGLLEDPGGSIGRMIARVEAARAAHGVTDPFNMTVATTDGQTLYAARYGSDGDGPSLYHSASGAALASLNNRLESIESTATIIVSEPLDGVQEEWVLVPPRSLVTAVGADVEISPLIGGPESADRSV